MLMILRLRFEDVVDKDDNVKIVVKEPGLS
jgi:hypothetical protein